ncbi:hypothetical protein AVEN_20237-1 [Araneus ventricosus]|uniref:Uncharacterized protein n=1 Tax=Araneus ventricosus TaxID=182803 RepID=A0A4Y2CLL3_ARAVE|nr:hypothetical protein AVEN_20237-1 [Araneus ventricosus]
MIQFSLVSYILTSCFEATRELFWDGPHNLEPMARTTSELEPLLQTSMPHQREGVWPLRMIYGATGSIHGGSSVESSFEPGTLRPQSRDLTTRLQRPFN